MFFSTDLNPLFIFIARMCTRVRVGLIDENGFGMQRRGKSRKMQNAL
jgi:hypothetical protein